MGRRKGDRRTRAERPPSDPSHGPSRRQRHLPPRRPRLAGAAAGAAAACPAPAPAAAAELAVLVPAAPPLRARARHPRRLRAGRDPAGRGLGKALDPAAFAEQIHADGLDRLLPAGVLALLALALEAGIGLALLLAVRRLWVLVPASLLVIFFLLLNGRAYWLAAHGQARAAASCGCFGNLVQRTPAEAFWQDLALLALPLALAFVGRDRDQPRLPPVRTVLVALFAIAVPVFAWRAPGLPLDDLATRLAPGATMSTLCAGGGGGDGGGGGGGGWGGGAAGRSAFGARAGAVWFPTPWRRISTTAITWSCSTTSTTRRWPGRWQGSTPTPMPRARRRCGS